MPEQEKKSLDVRDLDATELEADELESVAGGNNSGCPTINAVAGCGSPTTTKPTSTFTSGEVV